MFKIQFRKKKMQQEFNDGPYQDQYQYADDSIHGYDSEQTYNLESFETCMFCNDQIINAHIVVITKRGKHSMHMSCLISAGALLVNGFGLLVGLFKKRKEGG